MSEGQGRDDRYGEDDVQNGDDAEGLLKRAFSRLVVEDSLREHRAGPTAEKSYEMKGRFGDAACFALGGGLVPSVEREGDDGQSAFEYEPERGYNLPTRTSPSFVTSTVRRKPVRRAMPTRGSPSAS